jgi:transcriptional regulator with XRE-family HTH domain
VEKKIMAYKNEGLINTKELGRAIKRRREELNLSLRDVADVTQVSASTLSRIENGTGKPDADNIARLTGWLNMPIDRVMNKHQSDNKFVDAIVYYPHEATPEIVEAHLRADKNLTPETAKALSELFRVAYTQFSKPQE